MNKENLRDNHEQKFDDALKTKSVIENAKKEGQTALELTKEAAKKLTRAENLAVAEGAIGQMISSAALKKSTKAAEKA
ncbi:MAG: hypothetical protein E7218_06860 [Anaerofustis stercorihominis]|nr:hypothetical protein [Anaerofustis stercorihominis]